MLKYCDKDGIEKTIIDNENINDYVSGSGKGFPVFFHNNDLKIINDNGDIEIGESNDVNTHVTHITNDCNMKHELTVEGDMGVGGSVGIEGDMSVSGEIDQVGPLANLTTDAKNNLVSAINEAAAEKDKYWGGTTKKWEQFETDHPAEAAKVEVRYITDDSETGTVIDAVKDGDMRAVTSNAVYDAITDLTPVDTVTNGNMKPVTSNAVYKFVKPPLEQIMTVDFTKGEGEVICELTAQEDGMYMVIFCAYITHNNTGNYIYLVTTMQNGLYNYQVHLPDTGLWQTYIGYLGLRKNEKAQIKCFSGLGNYQATYQGSYRMIKFAELPA